MTEAPRKKDKPSWPTWQHMVDVAQDLVIKNALNDVSPRSSPRSNRKFENSLILTPDQGRSRSGSHVDDPELRMLEEELFNHCKQSENDLKANSGILLRELERMGILRDDPRLYPLIDTLKTIRKKTFSSLYGIDNIKLDFNQFTRVIKQSTVLISKAFKGQFVVPEFTEFTEDIVEIYEKCLSNTSGKPADYIPQLARADTTKWGVSLCTIDGQRFSVGDVNDYFSIQSTSKPFTYALAMDQLGMDTINKYIGREPSGRNFNEIVLDYNGQPHNPMINSGAIMSAALLLYMVKPEMSVSEKFEYVHDFFTRMAGGQHVGFQNSVFLSERDTADRNHAIAYYLRENHCFPDGPHNKGGGVDIKSILDFYFQTCSMEMNAASMSVMAATLANGGICPTTGERVLAHEAVKNVLSLMYSCGMYNYSGQFAFQVGLPAKSGVSGIVLVVVPNVVGFAVWSPSLDVIGNSVRGVMFAEELVKVYNFHTFESVGSQTSAKKNPKVQNHEEKSLKLVQLLFAACNGDKLALERAYLSGLDMNMGDYDNRTALHLACAENHLACVKFLIETCKVDVNVQDRWGNTPLQEAQRFHRPRVVAILKKEMARRGISVPVISEEGSESETSVVKVNGGGKNGESRDKSFKSSQSISINGTKYDETNNGGNYDHTVEMAALTIQGAFKRMKEKNKTGEVEDDISRPDVINM